MGLGYFGENKIKIDYLKHILQWNRIHLKNRNKTVYFKPIFSIFNIIFDKIGI